MRAGGSLIIVGGGIGGLTLAVALERRRFDYVVLAKRCSVTAASSSRSPGSCSW